MNTLINVHTHSIQNNQYVEIVNADLFRELEQLPRCSIGIHPWEIQQINIDESLNWIKKNLDRDNVIAIGEIGMDRAINIPLKIQSEVFKKQHQLAVECKKPILIHCVRAWSDLLAMRKTSKTDLPWIFHGYNGNVEIAKHIVKSGGYLSFGEGLLNNLKVQYVFKNLSLETVFLETDDAAIEIEEVYEKAAKIHHICTLELKEILKSNFLKVFRE